MGADHGAGKQVCSAGPVTVLPVLALNRRHLYGTSNQTALQIREPTKEIGLVGFLARPRPSCPGHCTKNKTKPLGVVV